MAKVKFITVKGSERLARSPFYVGVVQHERIMSRREAYASAPSSKLNSNVHYGHISAIISACRERGAASMNKIYFISGIDTGIGKTVATGLMARSLIARGVDAITVKMVQTGNDGFSEDIDAHRAIMGAGRFPEDDLGLTMPQIFKFPSSPLLAARLEGRTVDLDRISSAVATCAKNHDVVLVESAGGLDVPLTEDTLTADFAASQGWHLVLVACGRLGAINHALLSLDAAKMRNMPIAGVVFNTHFSSDPRLDEDAVAAIRRHMSKLGLSPVLVRIPNVDPATPAPDMDFSEIFA